MQTKNLIKIIKAEATVLVSMIESLPDDGDIQPFAIEMLQSKIRDLNNIAVHLSSAGADADNAAAEENARKLAEETARRAAEEEEARRIAETEAARKAAEELEAARKAMLEMQENARKQAEAEAAARKAAAEKEARRIAEAEASKRAAELERVRQIAIEEAANKAAAEEAAEEEAKKAKSLADMFADNTADVEQTYNAENEQQTVEQPAAESAKTESKPSTLADRFQQNTPSVNDVLAGLEKKANLASRFNSRPITNLRKAIKINDRIRFINELFDHDSIQYELTIDSIEQSANINEALSNIFNNHNWDQEDETTVDFLELVYQRFKAQ